MEIKILCSCGTKFKFEVEPVNGRMPAPVNCPSCGADATAQANAQLQPTPSVTPPLPVAAPAPGAPGGLRLNRPSAPASAPAAAVDEPAPQAHVPRPVPTRPPVASKNPILKTLTTVLILACVAIGVWRFGTQWYKRVNLVAKIASAVGEASVDNNSADEGAKNLWYENCAMLFVRHTNHLEVARACQEYWKTQLHKSLALIDSPQESMGPGEYELISAHNGYVRIVGAHEWPVPAHEALAQHLSQTFGTLVFEWRSESFADTYHFGVYDQGTRKFHAQMDVKITKDDAEESVTTEGNDFAIANGFKPGPNGFKEFHVLEADKLTQRLGMKLWDEKEGIELKGMLLKETGSSGG